MFSTARAQTTPPASPQFPQLGHPSPEEVQRSEAFINATANDGKGMTNRDWEVNAMMTTQRSERLAWRLFGVVTGLCALMAAALCLLVPLHRVVPYVITVDKVTGETAVVSTDDVVQGNKMLDKHWVAAFVLARERYDYQIVAEDFATVRRLSGDGPWAVYEKQFKGDNNLDKTLGENITVIPRILSVTLSDGNLATVRFEVTRTDRRQLTPPVVKRMVATLRYSYGKRILQEDEAMKNPLGFSVPGYQVDPELSSEVTQ